LTFTRFVIHPLVTGAVEGLAILAETVLNVFTVFTSWDGFAQTMNAIHFSVLIVAGTTQNLATIVTDSASAIVDNWS